MPMMSLSRTSQTTIAGDAAIQLIAITGTAGFTSPSAYARFLTMVESVATEAVLSASLFADRRQLIYNDVINKAGIAFFHTFGSVQSSLLRTIDDG
jgi:hypothetical protein